MRNIFLFIGCKPLNLYTIKLEIKLISTKILINLLLFFAFNHQLCLDVALFVASFSLLYANLYLFIWLVSHKYLVMIICWIFVIKSFYLFYYLSKYEILITYFIFFINKKIQSEACVLRWYLTLQENDSVPT